AHGFRIRIEQVVRAALPDRLEGGFGGEHGRFHGVVSPLDPGHVHETSRTADQGTTGENQVGYRLPSAFIDGPRAVGDAPSSLDFSPDRRMGLPALELLER